LNRPFGKIKHTSFFPLIISLALSGFIHLWNPVGFPDLFYDEGIYMRRAMHVLEGLGPQEAFFHDHPFFGQLFLAGAMAIIGYPASLNISSDVNSMELLYSAPRILMGIMAVIDTYLIYKISERRYSKNVAVIASILFAVMPITWLLRRILLDSILLPFLLSSILLALYAKDSKNKNILGVLSGICLGMAIFTKIPVFIMIPLIAFLVYSNNRNVRTLGLWFIPVILIPSIWPAQAVSVGQFDLWMKDIVWQMQRESAGFASIVFVFLIFDPVLFMLGIAGLVHAALKKDVFILLWAVPFIVFLALIGYVQYFYWIPVLPAFCIASARLVTDLVSMVRKKNLQHPTLLVVTCGIGIFGLVSSTMLVTTHVSSQLEAAAFVAKYVQNSDNNMTIISSPVYSWIFIYVFDEENVFRDYRDLLFYPVETERVILIADQHFKYNIGAGEQLSMMYNSTRTIATFEGGVLRYDLGKYPYTNMQANYEGSLVEVRINE
jgi:hypothetical protein